MITASPLHRNSAAYYTRYAALGGGGEWLGPGLSAIGHVPGDPVEPSEFHSILDGTAPVYERVVKNRRRGWDFTVAAPKSISLIAVAHPDQNVRDAVVEAHQQAVAQAFAYLAAKAGVVRLGAGGSGGFAPAHIAAAAFHHVGARPVKSAHQASPQPHLHTHVVVPNMAFRVLEALADPVDPQASVHEDHARAIVSRVLYEHAPAAGAVYRTALARSLSELGFGINRDGFSFDVAGFDEALIQRYSARSEQIAAASDHYDDGQGADASDAQSSVSEHPLGPSRAAQIRSQRLTRSGKIDEELNVLGDKVRLEMAILGYNGEWWDSLKGTPPEPNPNSHLARLAIITGAVVEHLQAGRTIPTGIHDSFVTSVLDQSLRGRGWCREADIYVTVASALPASATKDTLHSLVGLVATDTEAIPLAWIGERRSDKHSELFQAGVSDGRRHITRRFTSRRILHEESDLMALAMRYEGGPKDATLKKLAGAIGTNNLADEQAMALAVVLSNRKISLILGVAGSGKTTLVAELARACGLLGVPISGVSSTGLAALNLGAATGIPISTIDSALMKQSLPPKSILIVDEAARADNTRLAGLLRLAADHDCKVVLIGDDRQLAPINATSSFSLLAGSVPTAVLRTNRRQRHEADRDAIAALRAGYVERGMQSYLDRGQVRFAGTDGDLLLETLRAWYPTRQHPESYVLCHSRAETALVNVAIHLLLETMSQIPPPVWRCAATSTLTRHDAEPIVVPDRAFSSNERVMCLKNTYVKTTNGGTTFLPNGWTGWVKNSTSDGGLVVSGEHGTEIVLDDEYARRYVDYAWAITTQKSQGRTLEHVVLHNATSYDYALAFTALTRPRESAVLVCRYEVEERDRQAAVAALRAATEEASEEHVPRVSGPEERATRRSWQSWLAQLKQVEEPLSALAALREEHLAERFAGLGTPDEVLGLAGIWRHWADGGSLPARLHDEDRERLAAIATSRDADLADRSSARQRLALDEALVIVSDVVEWAQNLGHHPDVRFAERMAQLCEAAAASLAEDSVVDRGVVGSEAGGLLVSVQGPTAHDVSILQEAPGPDEAPHPHHFSPRQASLAADIGHELVAVAHETGVSPLAVYREWALSGVEPPTWLSHVPPASPELRLEVALCAGAAETTWLRRRPSVVPRMAPGASQWLQDVLGDIEHTAPKPAAQQTALDTLADSDAVTDLVQGLARGLVASPAVAGIAVEVVDNNDTLKRMAAQVAAMDGQERTDGRRRLHYGLMSDPRFAAAVWMSTTGGSESFARDAVACHRSGKQSVYERLGEDGLVAIAKTVGYGSSASEKVRSIRDAIARAESASGSTSTSQDRNRQLGGGYSLSL
ncbi:MAG: MobF family relaxase [Acidimicrobiales bacterium]